jgi:hypothetical protein
MIQTEHFYFAYAQWHTPSTHIYHNTVLYTPPCSVLYPPPPIPEARMLKKCWFTLHNRHPAVGHQQRVHFQICLICSASFFSGENIRMQDFFLGGDVSILEFLPDTSRVSSKWHWVDAPLPPSGEEPLAGGVNFSFYTIKGIIYQS